MVLCEFIQAVGPPRLDIDCILVRYHKRQKKYIDLIYFSFWWLIVPDNFGTIDIIFMDRLTQDNNSAHSAEITTNLQIHITYGIMDGLVEFLCVRTYLGVATL